MNRSQYHKKKKKKKEKAKHMALQKKFDTLQVTLNEEGVIYRRTSLH